MNILHKVIGIRALSGDRVPFFGSGNDDSSSLCGGNLTPGSVSSQRMARNSKRSEPGVPVFLDEDGFTCLSQQRAFVGAVARARPNRWLAVEESCTGQNTDMIAARFLQAN